MDVVDTFWGLLKTILGGAAFASSLVWRDAVSHCTEKEIDAVLACGHATVIRNFLRSQSLADCASNHDFSVVSVVGASRGRTC